MGTPLKLGKSDSSGTSGRRSSRLAIAIPISISGKDAKDQSFKENTRTVIINKHGAKIVTFHTLALGAEIQLENRALARNAKTIVVWLGDRSSPKDAQEVGIQLSEPQNIWGIEFAPDDWQEGPPIGEGGKRLEKVPAASTSAPGEAQSPPEQGAVSASPAEGEATVSRTVSSEQLDKLFEERFREFEHKLEQRFEQMFTKNQARLELAANRHAEMIQEGLDQRFGGLEQRLEPARANTEQLLAKIQDLQKNATDHLSRFSKDLEKQAGEALQKLNAELKSTGKVIADDARKQFDTVRQQAVDSLAQEGQSIAKDYPAQVRKTLQDFQDQRTRELEDHLQKALEKQRQAVLKQIQVVGDDVAAKAVAEVKSKCEEIAHIMLGDLDKRESTLKDWEDQASGRLEAYSQILEASSKSSAESFQTRLQEIGRTLEEKCNKEIEVKIREAALRQKQAADVEFDKRTQESLNAVAEQLREKQEEIIGEAGELFRTTLGQMFLGQQGSKKPSESESPSSKKRHSS